MWQVVGHAEKNGVVQLTKLLQMEVNVWEGLAVLRVMD
jgi:hypothetical protein